MSEIREKVKSRMGYLMLEEVSMPIGMPEKIVEKLLSILELKIVDLKAELPKNPYPKNFRESDGNYSINAWHQVYTDAQQDMRKAGWVKEAR